MEDSKENSSANNGSEAAGAANGEVENEEIPRVANPPLDTDPDVEVVDEAKDAADEAEAKQEPAARPPLPPLPADKEILKLRKPALVALCTAHGLQAPAAAEVRDLAAIVLRHKIFLEAAAVADAARKKEQPPSSRKRSSAAMGATDSSTGLQKEESERIKDKKIKDNSRAPAHDVLPKPGAYPSPFFPVNSIPGVSPEEARRLGYTHPSELWGNHPHFGDQMAKVWMEHWANGGSVPQHLRSLFFAATQPQVSDSRLPPNAWLPSATQNSSLGQWPAALDKTDLKTSARPMRRVTFNEANLAAAGRRGDDDSKSSKVLTLGPRTSATHSWQSFLTPKTDSMVATWERILELTFGDWNQKERFLAEMKAFNGFKETANIAEKLASGRLPNGGVMLGCLLTAFDAFRYSTAGEFTYEQKMEMLIPLLREFAEDLGNYPTPVVTDILKAMVRKCTAEIGVVVAYKQARAELSHFMKPLQFSSKPSASASAATRAAARKKEICHNFNKGTCFKGPSCSRRHACSGCNKNGHPVTNCEKAAAATKATKK